MKEKDNGISIDTSQDLRKLSHAKRPFTNPFIDVMFKKIFASETSKEILRCFLNEVLRGRRHIENITYGKNEYLGDSKREVICAKAYTRNGRRANFFKRTTNRSFF